MSESTGRGDRVKLFTLAEANALVPVVRPLLEQLSAAKRTHDEARQRLAAFTPAMRTNGQRAESLTLEAMLERAAATVARLVREIAGMGIQLKDIAQGIIDFPSVQRGRIVLLCWRLGEGEIEFWHEMNSGFAGRRPIADLS